jgi:hypothetical protein
MAAATMEAITNDALASIYELMGDCIPQECLGEPPWCYFQGRTTAPIAALLNKGSFERKRDYVMTQIEEAIGCGPEEDLIQAVDWVTKFRNRIVHMSFQERPGKYKALLNTKTLSPLAKQACDAARRCLDFLRFAFDAMNLTLRTVRPDRHFDDDLEQA